MNLFTECFIILLGLYICNAEIDELGQPQLDVQAPVYIPPYVKNARFPTTGYKGYGGTNRGYTFTKTGVPGTKTGYAGTKTAYTGTKTGYPGTKTGYSPTKSSYGERNTWFSGSGLPPSYDEFSGNAVLPFKPSCDIECKNNGICVDRNTCQCQKNYEGKYCEFEKKPCLANPPLPMNSERKCFAETCTIKCKEGHKFFDGSTVANLHCVSGQWVPTRADLSSISDCQPDCTPPCLNGGVCLGVNMCQCSEEYRGPQCQYSTSACDIRKLGFNGGYGCFGDSEKFSCRLTCPTGATFRTPAADLYTCHYSTGVFEPQPIPHCFFDQVIVITPSSNPSKPIYSTNVNKTTSEPHVPVIVVENYTPKGGRCLTWAGMHYKTFDGKIYSFQSPCTHILARDAVEHKYTVAIRQPECRRKDYCPSELYVYLEDKMYTLSVAEDGSVVFRSTKRLIPIPAALSDIRVSMPGDSVLVNLDALGITLTWDTNNEVLVEGSVVAWNKTEGLCGTLDGNEHNDLRIKDGFVARTTSLMAASWQLNTIGDICDSPSKETSACVSQSADDVLRARLFCNKIFSKEKFRKCSQTMDVLQLLEACQWDYCACAASKNAEECACNTVAVFAKECRRHGVTEMQSWRDADTCPMKCPEGKIYRSCGPAVQASCAQAQATPTDNSTCVEGCFCPEGLLLESGRCLQPNECPCRARNRIFQPGAAMPKGCNTCTCRSGAWICTQVPCGARCSSVGDPHYTTFDGLRYDFMGHCTYTLLSTSNITIDVENIACSGAITEAMNLAPYRGDGKPSCTKAVNLMYGNANIHLKQGGFILVNGKEVASLPVTVGDIRIRAASSLFIIIQLPVKVDLWWDGNTRVYVDVPPLFLKKTKGLCGTFNMNQKDDFLTPEGDVEQSASAFANKWKTREICTDVSTVEPEHPCRANMENKETAESYCSKLKSKIFESCHWYVDVQPFYEACLYDMCACDHKPEDCFCPVLGNYAMECAQAGVIIQWRYNVQECELACSGGQEYTVCADSCLRTCTDVALSTSGTCEPHCVEGCACPVGQVLDSSNVCVPVALCPCYHKGMQFQPGYKEVRAGRREQDICTCVGAQWDCVPATPEDIKNYPRAEDLRSSCNTTANMEFTTCQVAEPLTCKNMHLLPSATTQECRPGCQCRPGFVLDAAAARCVLPAACPCHHGGRSFPDGHTMMEECNTCECKSGNWSCTSAQCAGVCSAWGDSHVTTFDGADYDFEGVCQYLLAKGAMDDRDGFSVEIQNAPCGTTGATCSKSVTLRVGSGAEQESVSLTKSVPLPDVSKYKRIKLRLGGAYVFLDVQSLGVSLQWDRGMRVYVRVGSEWKARVKGLCGNYNSDMRDDFQSPSGGGFSETSPLIFADSWKMKPTCPKPQAVTDHCQERPQRKEWSTATCGAMKRYPFTLCHTEVPPSSYISRCEKDACACDSGADCECACTALAAYAHACAARGVTFKWRTQETCPMQCDGECSNYNECVSPCPPETCDNTLDYSEIKTVCERETCVEGCKPNKTCPEGTVYSNSSLSECVPRAKCKPVCMTLADGSTLLEGEIIEEDACHTCRCSSRERVCTGQPCSTEPFTGTTPTPETTPHDQSSQCMTGWTPWLNHGTPEWDNGRSVEREPLPRSEELVEVGSPMCDKTMMTDIECRTTEDHKTPKETNLNVECSLEKGLVCDERNKSCPDFQIRVYCNCTEEPFQCLNSIHPSYPHPKDCSKFYECTPDLMNPNKPHTVLKSCPGGLMYHPKQMVCVWPESVIAIKPECGTTTTVNVNKTTGISTTPTLPSSPTYSTSEKPVWPTIPTIQPREETPSTPTTLPVTDTPSTSTTPPVTETPSTPSTPTTPSICPPGQVYLDCAYPCDKLCDHFGAALKSKGECTGKKKCVSGCKEKSVANTTCEPGSMWRDERNCVPIKDCTCDSLGSIVKPGGVTIDGCKKCQCIDNAMHCDTSDCVTYIVDETPKAPLIEQTTPSTPSHPSSTISTRITITPTTVVTSTGVPNITTHHPLPTTGPTTKPPFPITMASSSTSITSKTDAPTTHTPSLKTDFTPVISTTLLPTTAPPIILIPSTVTPPLECNPDDYINLLWSGDGLPKSAFSASSSASALSEPKDAVLNGFPLDITDANWTPEISDLNQYIQVELPRREPIYGVYMQGSPFRDQYVTSYDVMYGDDGTVFSHVEGPDGKPKVFRGPTDSRTPMKQMIEPPIEAKFVRIRPLTWHNEIAVRFELIGCQKPLEHTETTSTTPELMDCKEPLGLAADLPIESIEVSSNNDARKYLRLDGDRGWRPLYSTPGEWIMFNFTSPRNLTGIKTKGGENGWVTVYNVMYTSDLATFNPVVDSSGQTKMFPANFDRDTEVLNEFRPPIHAQYLKVLPYSWNKNVEMRIEPIGCFEPYPVTEPTVAPSSSTAPPGCAPCPGLLPEEAVACRCAPTEYFDGENCVTRDQCPCVVGIITYPVGAKFRQSSTCDECICKLGGVTSCKPVQECACEPNLVPKLSKSNCECLCEPCPKNTKICPTSKLCLPLEKWCDGLQDCPDDEVMCTTSTPVVETVVTSVAPPVVENKPTTAISTVPTTPPTTDKPKKICPKVECPPGYTVKIVTGAPTYSHSSTADLPPPRPRYSYQRYYGGAKGGTKGGARGGAKGGFSKGQFSKGGFYGPPSAPQKNNAFSLEKPALNTSTSTASQECTQFKCIPKLPPPFKPGSTPPPAVCSTPACPPKYSLKLEPVQTALNECPQYSCVPPPERPVFCNVTGRTFNTFDGAEYKLDVCFHILARENRFSHWVVLVRKKCRLEGCRNELLVSQDKELILVKPNFMIEYDNFEYTVEQTSKICFQKNSFDVGRLGNGLYIKSRKYNFFVLYNKDGDVKIGVSKSYMGQVDGLCGAFDGKIKTDRNMPSGKPANNIDEFSNSWLMPGLPPNACKTKVKDPEKQKKVWDMCEVITKEPLSQCAKVLDLRKWRTICLEKICDCTELVINGTRMTEKECRCKLLEQLVAECLAADKDVDIDSWRTMMDCPADCPPPLVHYDCYRKRCEPTCTELGVAGRHCPAVDGQCSPGCYCPEGKLRHGDQCVLPADCRDCTCTGVGTPAKYVTFEGDDLPFLGNCTYLASRDRNGTGPHKYQVYATNGPCEENTASICTKIVHLIYETNVISISKDDKSKKLITTVNGSPVYKNPTKNEWATISLEKGQDVVVLLPELHVELTVLQAQMQFSVRVPSSVYGNRTEGLCGVCAGYQEHLLTSNGTTTDDFELYGKSWQATPDTLTTLQVPPQEQCGEIPPPPPCVLPPPDSNPCYNLNNVEKFGACHALLEPQPYLEQCEAELCELNRTDACPVLARYAADCARQGVCLDWRRELCPFPCETPLVYRSCVDCEQTCDNHAELAADPGKCGKPKLEGCFCPEGKVRVNNTCIEPTKCFPCDGNREHYAGDEWQEDACTKCSCSKLSGENAAHVACVKETCSASVCSQGEDRISTQKPGACCPEYICVPKPENKTQCKEPKWMECGFGQTLKQKTGSDGCKDLACECIPASECAAIPGDNEVDMIEPGMEKIVDNSSCCPRVQLLCRPHTCPKPPHCPQFHTLQTTNVTGKCCPEHKCEFPKDKCVVSLQWEASPQGGERPRAASELVLKEVDATWPDGPCRWCRCSVGAAGASAECRETECPIITSEQFVVEAQPRPFACCPQPVYVGCRDGDRVYKVGENWTSADNVCESYLCSQLGDGKLEKVTTVERCNTDCQQGWKYEAAEATSDDCCGQCVPVACVVDGATHDIGVSWTSADFCTNYTCVNLNGTLQVQSSNETCPEETEAMRKQFVMSEDKVPGKCCPKREPVACRVGNDIYQEGQSWPSSDPCKNYTCAREVIDGVNGTLTHAASTKTCERECARGYEYVPPPRDVCCGRCEQVACVHDGELVEPGKVWKSEDNCTTFTCNNSTKEMFVTSAKTVCPDVSTCAPANIINDTCCQICKPKPEAQSTCSPVAIPESETQGVVTVPKRWHGRCSNREPIRGLHECRGICNPASAFNNKTGAIEAPCECCKPSRYESILVTLHCTDGTAVAHKVASATVCRCFTCLKEPSTQKPTYWSPSNWFSKSWTPTSKNSDYNRNRGNKK